MIHKVAAILVLYNPNIDRLLSLLEKLRSQVDQLLLINNGHTSDELERCAAMHSAHYVQNSSNLGIAAAQNFGMKWAIERGFSHVLTMDQDSLAENDMVRNLLSCENIQLSHGVKVGAVGPTCLEFSENLPSGDAQFPKQSDCLMPDRLISSGMLIRTEVLLDVGFMNERFFIDGVDDDWCFRAKYKGYQLLRGFGAKMQHAIGETKKVFNGKLVLRYHEPSRYYFLFRNYLFLARQYYVPFKFKLQLLKTLGKEFAKIIFLPEKLEYLKNTFTGLLDSFIHAWEK